MDCDETNTDGSVKLVRSTAKGKVNRNFDVNTGVAKGQFYKLYMARMEAIRPCLEAKLGQYTGYKFFSRILDCGAFKGKACMVGTIFKCMPKKPAALDEFVGKNDKVEIKPQCYTSEEDQVILEDKMSRIELYLGDGMKKDELYTGMVVAVTGEVRVDKSFQAEQIILPGPAPSVPRSLPEAGEASNKYIALVSGIQFGNPNYDMVSLQVLIDWIEGYLGGDTDVEQASKIVRVVLAGETFYPNETDKKDVVDLALRTKRQRNLDNDQAFMVIEEIDAWISKLSESVEVDMMPGSTDPSNFYLPQQPFHHCLLPKSCANSLFHTVTNPHSSVVDGVHFLGIAGQNVADQKLYGSIEETLTLMQQHMETRNICPTAPDTLGCFPFQQEDPFILKQSPHVYFVGNQDKFESKLIDGADGQKIRLVSIPSFWKSREVVLVNLGSLECKTVSF